jgi:hypothetical protein
MRTVPCRACQAPVGFVEMADTGRSMPVDPELVKTFIVEPAIGVRGKRVTLVTERGKIVKGVEVSLTAPGAEAVEGYGVHWATCTKPNELRKP